MSKFVGEERISLTKLTVSEALRTNADEQARLTKLSRESGIPAFAIEGNENDIEQDIAVKNINFHSLAKKTPATFNFISDAERASISSGDLDTLTALEGAVLAGKNALVVVPQLAEASSGILESPFRVLEAVTQPVADLSKKVFGFKSVTNPFREVADIFAGTAAQSRDQVAQLTADNSRLPGILRDVASGGQSGVHSVVLLGAAIVSRNPRLMLPLMGASTFGTSVSEGLEQGLPIGKALQFAGSQAGVEVFTEKLAFTPLLKILQKTPGFMKNVFSFFAREILGEQLATGLQEMTDWAILPENRGKPFSSYIEERPDAAISTLIATIVGGGLQVSVVRGISYYVESQYKKAEAAAFNTKDNADEQQSIEDINFYSNESATRQRDPETFRQFVKGIDEETSIHIDAEHVRAYLQDKTDNEIAADPALTEMQNQLTKEGSLRATVDIPIADFATDMTGSEHYNALRQHMTLNPESPTPFRQKEAEEQQQSYLDSVMEEAQANVSEYAEAQEIFTAVRDQLVDSGQVDSQQASAMANIVPAYMTVKAKELGIGVAEVYEKFGLTVAGPQTGKAADLKAEGVLKQTAPEFSPDFQAVAEAMVASGGVSLNADGTEFTGTTGYVATLRSVNIEQGEDLNESLSSFAAENSSLLARDNIIIGAFDFGDETGRRSVDINVVVQDREQAIKIGTDLNQDSIYDLANQELIKTGGSGGTGLTLKGAQTFLNKQEGTTPPLLGDLSTEDLFGSKAEEAYDLVVKTTGAGPFDGGCCVVAPGIQKALGGEIVALTKDGVAQHAAVKIGRRLYDYSGARPETEFVEAFSKLENVEIDGVRPFRDSDLIGDAVRDEKASDKIAAIILEQGAKQQFSFTRALLGSIEVPTDDTGQITLTHHSKQEGLQSIDPTFHGTGFAGRESNRKKENPAAWVNRTYYGIEEGTEADYQPEPEVGPVVYKTSVNPLTLYDFDGDPLGIKARSKDFGVYDVTTYEKNIKDAGYTGYWVKDPQVGLVVASFYTGIPDGQINVPRQPVLKQAAFHGTPHEFDKFSVDAIGTGEGVAAFGHGLYFTENEEIAKYYKETLVQTNEEGATKGRVVEVELSPKNEEYFLWDKPIGRQSEIVKSAVKTIKEDIAAGTQTGLLEDALQEFELGSTKGYVLYNLLARELSGPSEFTEKVFERLGAPLFWGEGMTGKKAASLYLHALGVRGIKYLAEGSRGRLTISQAFNIKYNFVIFSEDDVTIKRFYQSAALRRGTETLKRFGLDPKKRHNTRTVAAALEARTRQKHGTIARDDRSPEASKKIAKWMVDEVLFELENPGRSGVGWYSEKFQNAIDSFGEEFPELLTDQTARNTFTLLIAITSDQQSVVDNLAQAAEIYNSYRVDGTFESKRKTGSKTSIDNNLRIIADMFSRMTPEQVHENLLHEETISNLKKIAKKNGFKFETGYQAGIVRPMAAIVLGPKLGIFYANLMGFHGYLTMDRWWARTFNRYRGTLLTRATKQGLTRFKDLIGEPDISDDEVLTMVIAPATAYAKRGFKSGTEIEKAANTIYKATFVNTQDMPFNATDRTFMIDAVNRAQKSLNRRGHSFTVADIQAILWYYEKRLYGELGARQTADISYEEAAKRVTEVRRQPGGQNVPVPAVTGPPVGEDAFNQGQQIDGDVTRGYYDPENTLIRLTESADLSTFLHEFAHFMYDMEKKSNGRSVQPIHKWFKQNADQIAQQANDRGSVMVSGVDVHHYIDDGTTGDLLIDAAIEESSHEYFARGFETYVMEGKAPSAELRNVFRTFARWLVQVYQSVKGDLGVTLDDDIRQVFDRLIATEEQIAAAQGRANFKPLFTDAVMAGMTEKQFQAYKERQQKSEDVAHETLRDKMIKQVRRQTLAWWKTEKQDMVDDEKERLRNQPVYKAREVLRGELKLDHASVKERYGREQTNKLGRTSVVIPPALRGMTAKGGEGVTVDDAAAFLGYESGDQMVKELIDAPTLNDQADSNAEARMKEKHGDILTDGTIEQVADEAVMNEERGKLILAELKVLLRGTNKAVLDRQTLKFMAEERIGELSFRQIAPGKYRAAEVRAAQESATALANGDTEAAANAKTRQAMNHYLAIAAAEAKNDVMNIVDRQARYRKKQIRENIIKAGNGYMEQIDKILTRFEFRKSATLKQVDKVNQSLADWARERMEVDGDAVVLDPAVLDETYVTHWKNVRYSDIKGISESLKNLEHVARYSNKIKLAEEELEFQQVVARWVDHMNQQPTKFKSQRTDVARGKRVGRWAMAQMTKIPWMASWLDGGERAGMSHDILMHPLNVAYAEEVNLWGDVGSVVMDAIKNRGTGDLVRHNRKVFIPEIRDDKNDGNLMGHQVLAVALNVGNQSNLKKMLLGEGWASPENESEITIDNPKLQAVLAHMTLEDWTLVQTIWDQMELLYPQLAEVHRRTTGLVPPKIKSTPVETPFGTFRGGYYPVKYDPKRSHKAAQDEAKANAEVESMFGAGLSLQASVNASSTSERTGFYAPIRLSLDVVQNHFQETIHYITHHDAVRQINKLTRNKAVAETIRAKLGEEEYAQLRPWLNDVAKDGREKPAKMFWDAALQKLRFGTTLGIMGFKASTGLMQLLGLSNTAGEVGTANLIQAMRTIIGSPETMASAWDFAVENSLVMGSRAQTMDREIRSAMIALAGKKGIIAGIQETSMKHIALIQTYMVDLPTWHAAYIKGMTEWGDEKRAFKFADWAVQNIQGSGLQKDMARIMRGQSETGRMFTMFMTFFSSLWNMERDLARGATSGQYSTTNVAAKAMFFFAIPVLLEMWMRGEFDPDDDDEEDTRLQKYLLNVALYPVQGVPFARDVANGLLSGYGYNMSPIAQLLEGGIKAIPQIAQRAITDEEITKGQAKAATKFIGAAAGVPGVNQVWATGEHLYDVIESGEDITVRELIYGPKR